MTPIRYYDFWDVPRAFIAADDQGTYLLECSFNDQLDDFPEHYEVYSVPELDETARSGSWAELMARASHCLGRVPVDKVHFDQSRRREVDLGGIRQFLLQQ